MIKKSSVSMLLVLVIVSCNNMNKLKRECEGITKEDYRPDNLIEVDNSEIRVNGIPIKTSYDSLINEFGKEEFIGDGKLYDKEYKSFQFNKNGNRVQYLKDGNSYILTEIQFVNEGLEATFKQFNLDYNLKLKDFRAKEKEAFCNSIYFEQTDRFDLQYRGTIKGEVYTVVFEKGKLKELRISWPPLN